MSVSVNVSVSDMVYRLACSESLVMVGQVELVARLYLMLPHSHVQLAVPRQALGERNPPWSCVDRSYEPVERLALKKKVLIAVKMA